MKLSTICFMISLAVLVSCSGNSQDNKKSGKESMPKIVFEQPTYDFGKVSKGEKVSHTFKFKNKGEAKLKIKDVEVSCGCTVPEYKKTVIPPGETGRIKVTFDSGGFFGDQKKQIIVYTNSKISATELVIKAYVS